MNEELLFAMIEDLQQELKIMNSNLAEIKNELSDIKHNTHSNADIVSKLEEVLEEVKKIRRNTQ